MIATVTLNASIDKLYVVDKLDPGKVSRVRQVEDGAGGKGLNVARVVGLLGERAIATGLSGGHAGARFAELAAAQGLNIDFVGCEGETRACINVRDLETGRNTEFLEPGPTLGAYTLERFYRKFQKLMDGCEVVTISGSLPRGAPVDYYQRLIYLAKSLSKTVILDSSGEALFEGIRARPTLIKPNLEELSWLTGTEIRDLDQALGPAGKLREQGVGMVAVSLGAKGVLVVTADGAYEGIPPTIEVVNTVGCGDSMVAGFAVGLKRGLDIMETIRLAVAASSANAMSLETGHFEESDYNELIP
ncbi:MAG: 1-phosphofructokinase family hexose kinase, partial [Deltaproteobacteria bacterium]|nr:1-phosphofructokinase family hexose kinase [Deltaproteobacteria bacterium]